MIWTRRFEGYNKSNMKYFLRKSDYEVHQDKLRVRPATSMLVASRDKFEF